MTAGGLRSSPCAFMALSGSAVVQNQLIFVNVALEAGSLRERAVLRGFLTICTVGVWITVFE